MGSLPMNVPAATRRFHHLIVALMVALPLTAAGDGTMRPVDVYDGLVTLEIPEDWNEIPPDVLEFYSLQSAEDSGGLTVEIYQYGFRPGNPEADFAPPQILIQIKENGRLGLRQFLHLPSIDTLRNQGTVRLEGHMGPLMDDLLLNDVFFDRETYSLHVSNTLDLKIEGKAIVRSVSFLTERGLFTVHCYALISQNVTMKPVFDRILDSVRLDDSIRYRPTLADRLPPRPALISYGIALTLAVVAIVVHFFQRRRRTT